MEVAYKHPSKLPPGFRFDPSDEELILNFLYPKVTSRENTVIPDIDLSVIHHPWDLTSKAFCGCNIWYFYSRILNDDAREQETETGYWRLQDVEDEPIYSSSGKKIGWKRFYVFYIGEPPLGIQTSWILEEYHLSPTKSYETERWVLCRVLETNDTSDGFSYQHGQGMDESSEVELSSLDEVFLSLEEDDAETLY